MYLSRSKHLRRAEEWIDFYRSIGNIVVQLRQEIIDTLS